MPRRIGFVRAFSAPGHVADLGLFGDPAIGERTSSGDWPPTNSGGLDSAFKTLALPFPRGLCVLEVQSLLEFGLVGGVHFIRPMIPVFFHYRRLDFLLQERWDIYKVQVAFVW